MQRSQPAKAAIIVKHLRDLASQPLPEGPTSIKRGSYRNELSAYNADVRHRLDMLQRDAGRLLADAVDFLPDVVSEPRTMLRDIQQRGADSTALRDWFGYAASWFALYQQRGQLRDIEREFPADESEPSAMVPSDRCKAQHKRLTDTILAFADVIEVSAKDEPVLRPYAVRTGTTLQCVMAESHLAAAATTLGTLLDVHCARLPDGCIDDILTVAETDDSESKEISVKDCIRYMIAMDLCERNALIRAMP